MTDLDSLLIMEGNRIRSQISTAWTLVDRIFIQKKMEGNTSISDLHSFIRENGYRKEGKEGHYGPVMKYVVQMKASYENAALCPGGSPTEKVLLSTMSPRGDLVEFSIPTDSLELTQKDGNDNQYLRLTLEEGGYRSDVWNETRVKARPMHMKFAVGQALYDVSRNESGRIMGVPISNQYVANQRKPVYAVMPPSSSQSSFFKGNCNVNGRVWPLALEQDIEHLVVGPTQMAAASKRIIKWYKDLCRNRIVRICEGARSVASSRGPGSLINRMCRTGSVGEIRSYLLQHSSWDINSESQVTHKTALREAVEYHNIEVIILLVSLGANPNKCDGHGYILYAALRDTSPGALKTTRILLSLMETKADPDGEAGSSDKIASSDGKCYWLDVSRRRMNYRKEDMVKMGVPHLPRFIFALAGQPYAQRTLVKEIAGRLANQEKYRRMVFVLGGPPGHGKTMAGKELCKALGGENPEQDFVKISCANVNSVFELFGGSGAYQGSDVGSELNNFVVTHRDRIGVVNLDEFDRLKPQVRDGLFTIFDKGEWVDKKSTSAYQTKTLDCSKIVWVLTTNAFDNEIVGFYEKERKDFEKHNWKTLDKKIKRGFKGSIETQFGEAMSRRIGSLIPFVPFTKQDRIAFIEEEIDEWRSSYSKPPSSKKENDGPVRLVGNFEFTVDPNVVSYIADAYDKLQGATSLKDFLEEEIVSSINDAFLEGGSLEHTVGHFSLVGNVGEEEIEFEWPVENDE